MKTQGENEGSTELVMKTQGEIEAAICEGVSRFEQDYMGRGPNAENAETQLLHQHHITQTLGTDTETPRFIRRLLNFGKLLSRYV